MGTEESRDLLCFGRVEAELGRDEISSPGEFEFESRSSGVGRDYPEHESEEGLIYV